MTLSLDTCDTIYVSDCPGICGERVGSCTPEPVACWDCRPHVCTPELPEDDWCDYCGKDI